MTRVLCVDSQSAKMQPWANGVHSQKQGHRRRHVLGCVYFHSSCLGALSALDLVLASALSTMHLWNLRLQHQTDFVGVLTGWKVLTFYATSRWYEQGDLPGTGRPSEESWLACAFLDLGLEKEAKRHLWNVQRVGFLGAVRVASSQMMLPFLPMRKMMTLRVGCECVQGTSFSPLLQT